MLTAANNEMLTRVGPGTPMGNLMRNTGFPPVCPRNSRPTASRCGCMLLGEQLHRLPRHATAEVGVMEHRCPHRCASLFFGRNEGGGLRCVYHGWKFDVEGNCLDMPNVPPRQDFKRPRQGQGLPGGRARGLHLDLHGRARRGAAAAQRRGADAARGGAPHARAQRECNWLQSLEGDIDTSHFGFLHVGGAQGRRTSTRPPSTAGRVGERAPDYQVDGDRVGHDVRRVPAGRARHLLLPLCALPVPVHHA